MSRHYTWAVVASLFLSLSTVAQADTFPLNNLHLEDNPKIIYRVSPSDFHRIIARVKREFEPIVRSYGATLQVEEAWSDSTVNAYPKRPSPDVWVVRMFGGLARRKEMTQDGFALVMCHELGHHLAGYPLKGPLGNPWSASEGQADYWSTQVCARKIWWNDREENARHRLIVDPFAKQVCDIRLGNQMERDLCYRTANAGIVLAKLLNRLQGNRRDVAFPMFIRDRVPETFVSHPLAQCRLDTYLNGAVCRKPWNLRMIPGAEPRFDSASVLEREKEAALYSCEDLGSPMDGARPRCWFRPLLKNW